MKKIIFILLTIVLFSCSNSGDNQSQTTPPEPNSKLLTAIKEVEGYFQFSTFNYNKNSLIKMNYGEMADKFTSGYMEVHQVGYTNGKISRIAHNGDYSNTNPDDFSYNYNLDTYGSDTASNPTSGLEIISYTNNNSILYKSIYRNYEFNLNNQQQVVNILENSKLADEFILSNNQVVKQIHYGSEKDEYTFVYDNKINPSFELYKKYGVLNSYVSSPLPGHAKIYYNFLSNNPTKIYKNSSLTYTLSYQYDTENYPISVVVYDSTNKRTSKYIYTYK